MEDLTKVKNQEKELKALKERIKNPAIQKSIEEKQKYVNKPLNK